MAMAPPATYVLRAAAPVARLPLSSADGARLHGTYFPAHRPRAGLLLVHGLQSHARWFEVSPTAAHLADAGVSCLAYDRRGSGRSGGRSGHTASADEFGMDFAAAVAALRSELDTHAGPAAPLHVLANCFGTRVVLPYVAAHPDAIRSVILTAPATHMSRGAHYGLRQKLSILLAAADTYFPVPLRDEDFVSEGPALEWIRGDTLSLRRVTAGFLRSANRLTRRMWHAIPQLRVPLLVVLSLRDVLVDNDAIKERFVAPYAGPKEVVEYDTDHYVDFTSAQPDFERRLEAWLSEHT